MAMTEETIQPTPSPTGDRPSAPANDSFKAPSRNNGHKITARGAASREKILLTALNILAESGFAALSISNVCKQAGASGASLYHHFGDKAGLLNAMVEYAVDESSRNFAETAATKQRPIEQIEVYVEAVKNLRLNSPVNTPAILLSLSQACGKSPETAEVVARAQRYVWELSTKRFVDFFEVEDTAILTHLHMAFMSYVAQTAQSGGSQEDIDALFASFRRLLIITAASIRPDFMDDPDFAAAFYENSNSA